MICLPVLATGRANFEFANRMILVVFGTHDR